MNNDPRGCDCLATMAGDNRHIPSCPMYQPDAYQELAERVQAPRRVAASAVLGMGYGTRGRKLTLYRDDSTVQVVFDRVKSVFWTAGNTVLVISRYDAADGDAHHYIHWPRERFCWFKDQPQ